MFFIINRRSLRQENRDSFVIYGLHASSQEAVQTPEQLTLVRQPSSIEVLQSCDRTVDDS